jgi:hypothetical protein
VAERWRECADAYRRALERSNIRPKDYEMRYYAVNGFAAVLKAQLRGQSNAADHAMLKAIGRGKHGDYPEVRMNAEYTRGLTRWDQNDRDGAARCYRRVLEIQAAVTDSDTQHEIVTGAGVPEAATVVQARHRREATFSLATLEQRTVRQTAADKAIAAAEHAAFKELAATVAADARLRPDATRAAEREIIANLAGTAQRIRSTDADREVLARCRRVRGACCDACGTSGSVSCRLNMCTRCKRRWYCGSTCQKAAWPRHKLTCRAPGKFRVGDLAVARDPTSTNGIVVTITGPGPESETGPMWNVAARLPSGAPPLTLPAYPVASLDHLMDDGT